MTRPSDYKIKSKKRGLSNKDATAAFNKKKLQQGSNFNTKDYGVAGNLAVGNTPYDKVVDSMKYKKLTATVKKLPNINLQDFAKQLLNTMPHMNANAVKKVGDTWAGAGAKNRANVKTKKGSQYLKGIFKY